MLQLLLSELLWIFSAAIALNYSIVLIKYKNIYNSNFREI
jgi:hypothetical protein